MTLADIEPSWVLRVRDLVDERIAERESSEYISPPQARGEAVALVALLIGPTPADDERDRWTVAIAGGRRIVSLEPAA